MKHIMALSVLAVCLILQGSGCATSRIAKRETQITIDAAGAIAVQGQHTTIADLQQSFANLDIPSNSPIVMRVDKQTAYNHVVAVLNELRTMDYWNVSFATTQ
jgi:biopolymer transport protein ExbD